MAQTELSNPQSPIEQWGIFELALSGSTDGNPFIDNTFAAHFSFRHRTITVDGFYDGDGVYRVRFMPDVQGEWRYRTHSNLTELDGQEGSFTCGAPSAHNHGPVQVANTYHFAYADGAPYKQIGTTCYVWNLQGDVLEEQTLATLAAAPFNKIRFCVFPKHYRYNENEPAQYPYPCLAKGSSKWLGSNKSEIREGWKFDFDHFVPAYFQHLEKRVGQLRDLGIEADIILFHPYDRWGFSTMDAAHDDHYLRYIVARLAAYRNVWWSMANEFDLMDEKSMADWDRFFHLVQESDPYQHLRSVHNCRVFYDHAKPWVTHQSIQYRDLTQVNLWRSQAKKPVVVDECAYEGDIPMGWGNISAREMVHRFWEGAARGGYVGHGETYLDPGAVLWWSKGGVLHGESAPRLAFLRQILEAGPVEGLDPMDGVMRQAPCAGKAHEYYLIYTGPSQPALLELNLPEGENYQTEIIDTWEMTTTKGGVYSGRVDIPMAGRPYHAMILRRV
ncbi:MAG: DUF5060 domain-containing protein [Caldilineaceae bacterium]